MALQNRTLVKACATQGLLMQALFKVAWNTRGLLDPAWDRAEASCMWREFAKSNNIQHM